jgi:hypothetical protein
MKMAEPPKNDDGGAMRAAILSVGVCAIGLAAAGFAFFGASAGFGVAVGGAIATANLWLFARIGQAFLQEKGRGPWIAIAIVKLVFLFGGVFLLIKNDIVSGISLAVGYGAMPLGITLGSLFGPKPPDDAETR